VKTITILLDTIEKVRNFVSIISLVDGEFDIVSERYVIDAKSIMGIFSLDLSKPLQLNIHNPEALEKSKADFSQFVV